MADSQEWSTWKRALLQEALEQRIEQFDGARGTVRLLVERASKQTMSWPGRYGCRADIATRVANHLIAILDELDSLKVDQSD